MTRMQFFYWLRLQFWRDDLVGELARLLIIDSNAPVNQTELDSLEQFLLVDNPSSNILVYLDAARKEYDKV